MNVNLGTINNLIDKLYVSLNECQDICDEIVDDLKKQNERKETEKE